MSSKFGGVKLDNGRISSPSSTAAIIHRESTSAGSGIGLRFSNDATDSNLDYVTLFGYAGVDRTSAFTFSSGPSGVVGTVSKDGQWSLGADANYGESPIVTKINGGAIAFRYPSSSTYMHSIYVDNGALFANMLPLTFRVAYTATAANTIYAFTNNSDAVIGRATNGGSWTLGPSTPATNAVSHNINGDTANAAGALFVKNFNTTNAAPAANFHTYATGITVANKIINFIIANGSTNGAIGVAAPGSVQFTTYSDRRLKENIVDLPPQLANILALRPVEFDYKKDSPTGSGHSIGFIAQEVEEVYPDNVSYVGTETEEYKEVGGLSRTDARLIKAIQEQQQIIEQLKARIEVLENK